MLSQVIETRVNTLSGRSSRYCVTLLVLALLCGSVQNSYALEGRKDLRQYLLRTWTSAHGLPQDSIHALLQTRDGFLWVGTRGGLARFDGVAFVVYKAGAPNTIPSNSVNGLAEDRDGGLWIASDGGLTRYRNGRFETFNARDGLPSASIWRMAADPDGGVWAITRNSELFHFDGRKVARFGSSFSGRAQDVNALVEDSSGTLWIATFHGLFSFRNGQEIRRYGQGDGLAGDRLYALALDRVGQLWTAGDGGLSRASAPGFVPVRVPHLKTATLLAFDPEGADDAVWTGATGEGLFRLSRKGAERLRATQGLVSDEQYLLYFSQDGSLWLGALNGLNQLSEGAVTSFGAAAGWPKSTFNIQRAQGLDGELWFGENASLYHVRDGALGALRSMAAEGGSDALEAARFRLRNYRAVPLWVRSNDKGSRGLVLRDGHNRSVITDGTTERALPTIPWDAVGSMLIDERGTIWTAGSETGVVAYPLHGAPHAYTTANGLDDNNVLSLTEDTAGNIWVGTISGLNRIHDGAVNRVFPCPDVNAIDPSADGSLWAGSDSGLIYVPPNFGAPSAGSVRVFTQRDNLPTSLIEGVAQSTDGYLWMGTEQGVVRLAKADLLARDAHTSSAPVVFGVGDGLHSAQVRINSVFRSRNGDIWFQTLGGLAVIEPRRALAEPLARIAVDQLEIDGRDVGTDTAQPLVVPAGRHRLTFRYTLPEFRFPSRIQFRYRLEGWDKQWTDASGLRSATYTGIPPGRYTFQVANSDGYGSWASAGRNLPIRVEPYFYQSGWFFGGAALFLVGGISQLHRLRVARVSTRMDARMQERTRIARELHDTLLQGVLGVSMQMYAAHQETTPTVVNATLRRASQRLREIAEQSRQAVEDLRSPLPSPGSLERAVALALRTMDLPNGVEPRIHCAGVRTELSPSVQTQVERIVREAVANAVQHSGADAIRIDILYQPTHFFVSVSDNGRGIHTRAPERVQHGHWGIPGMSERAQSIGACLRILPNTPRGTVVELSISGADAYRRAPQNRWWMTKLKRFGRQQREPVSTPEIP